MNSGNRDGLAISSVAVREADALFHHVVEAMEAVGRKKPIGIGLIAMVLAVGIGCDALRDSQSARSSNCEPASAGDKSDASGTSEFSKPDSYADWSDPREGLRPAGWNPDKSSGGMQGRSSYRPREYTRPTERREEIWLYEGEPAVIDFGVWWGAPQADADDEIVAEILVFVDFKPVEFTLHRVEGKPGSESFPSVEEATSEEDLRRSDVLEIPNDTRKAYTIAIPPEAFGEVGAHDVRIAWFHKSEPDTSKELKSRPSRGWKMTVNYGGTEFVAPSKFSSMEAERKTPPRSILTSLDLLGTLLVPPGTSSSELPDTNVGRVIETSESTVDINGWMQGDPVTEDLQSATVVLDGARMIDGSRSLITLPKRPSLFSRETGRLERPEEPYAANFQLEVPLETEGQHEIRMFSFMNPFCRKNALSKYHVSNSIFVERSP